MIALILFLLCIPVANWLIGNVGTVCIPEGPCLIPVFPGVMAPSGVMLAGAALVLRDVVHRQMGAWWAAGAIVAGAVLSLAIASPQLAMASGFAFLLSEAADFAVYAPLAKRRWILAVVASSMVGLVVDSMLFLQVAFGSLDHLSGQVIAKTYAVVLIVPLLILWRRRAAQEATA